MFKLSFNFLPPPPILNVGMPILPGKDDWTSLRHRTINIVLGKEGGAKTRCQADCNNIIDVKYLLYYWVLSEIVVSIIDRWYQKQVSQKTLQFTHRLSWRCLDIHHCWNRRKPHPIPNHRPEPQPSRKGSIECISQVKSRQVKSSQDKLRQVKSRQDKLRQVKLSKVK